MYFDGKEFVYFNEVLLKFVPKALMDNKLALVRVVAWCPACDKPLSEPSSLTLIVDASNGIIIITPVNLTT